MLNEIVIDKLSALPLHAQIETCVRDLIASGRLSDGERLPNEIEIAEALGVSRMTVNKAILALTREGLLRRERGLGTYVTSPGAVTRHLMIVIHTSAEVAGDEHDYYFAPLCRAIQREAEARHHRVSIAYVPEGGYLQAQSKWRVDGWLLIAPNEWRLNDMRALHRTGAPMVVVGACWDEFPDIPMVDSDNVAGAATAVRHLLTCGHRRIAMVYAGPESSNTLDRIKGYRHMLAEAGEAVRSDWEIHAHSSEELGDALPALRRVLELPADERPTAVFAAGYYLALKTLGLAHDLCLAVPDDLSVIGYDDPFAARLAYPPLTTLSQPLADMGCVAVTMLDGLLRGERPAALRSLHQPVLQIRASVGQPSPAGPPLMRLPPDAPVSLAPP